jgi:Pyruvate/2-oxoacid:ferredoxin oxidoreductase delta subunit
MKAIERDLIPDNFQQLDIQGIDIADFKPIPFKVPVTSRSRHIPIPLPETLDKFLYKILRPSPNFIHEKCVGCGLCAQNCPAKCIEMIEQRPHVDLSRCIRCFCCQELCPYHAVEIKRNKLSKIIFR